jgi:hypothetical protein
MGGRLVIAIGSDPWPIHATLRCRRPQDLDAFALRRLLVEASLTALLLRVLGRCSDDYICPVSGCSQRKPAEEGPHAVARTPELNERKTMPERRTFWSSGVSTQIEFPERLSFQRRYGWGLEVEQPPDAAARQNNWFHIPLPCESRDWYLGAQTVDAFMLRMHVNENARVAELHLRDGVARIASLDTNLVDREIAQEFLGPNTQPLWNVFGSTWAGLTLCVRVEFLTGTPRGHVKFYGAGVRLRHIEI